jgi:hypothetical protein
MTTITKLDVGSLCFTHRGNSGIVERLENERVIIRIPDGTLKSIPLTAIASYELPSVPISPDCITETLPNSFPVGCIVHKTPQVGWTGIVLKHIGTDSVEVLWVLDKHPTLMAVSGLRMADKAVTESSLKAFTKLGVIP